jgi:hypothetical protein
MQKYQWGGSNREEEIEAKPKREEMMNINS